MRRCICAYPSTRNPAMIISFITEPLPCDYCGQLVPLENSVTNFEATRQPHSLGFFGLVDRHLFPVDGPTPCAGSPSRYQYFKGYPRDPRGKTQPECAWKRKWVKPSRDALAAMKARFGSK